MICRDRVATTTIYTVTTALLLSYPDAPAPLRSLFTSSPPERLALTAGLVYRHGLRYSS